MTSFRVTGAIVCLAMAAAAYLFGFSESISAAFLGIAIFLALRTLFPPRRN